MARTVYTLRIPQHTKSMPRPKINRRTGGAYFAKNYVSWREQFTKELAAVIESESLVISPAPSDTPVEVRLKFYNARKTSDIDNLSKSILDILQGIVYEDDRQVTKLVAEKIDSKKDFTEIQVIYAGSDPEKA